MTDPLFQPLQIGAMTLRNRIVMPAMHLNLCRDYRVTEELLAFYAERAAGGAGLIIAGYAAIDGLAAHPGHIGAQDDALLPGLTRLAATLREAGARAALQLNHAGRYNSSLLLGGRQPVAPSPVPSRLTGETPRELTVAEIDGIVAGFAAAAARVKQAGFDAVEILAGTGYLISQFLSPLTNRRRDGYGGGPETRMRFGIEVVTAVRAAVGEGFPLLVRLNGNDLMPGGMGRQELQAFAGALETAGADAFNVNVGWHEAPVPQIVTKVPRGVFAYLARGIRERVAVPVIAGHRINDPAIARELLSNAACDAVAMGRALIADPQLPVKARDGREEQIVHCVACGQGCFDNLFRLRGVTCLCNPRAGRETQTAAQPAAVPRQVLVVGGGPAGMAAALSAAACGHAVTLAERGSALGGQLALAGAPPGREEFAGLARDLAAQVAAGGIRVRLETAVDADFLEIEQPETVILASGGTPALPPLPGVELPHVVQAWKVLAGRVRPGRRVAVIGGGAVGVETALLLAEEGALDAEAVKFLLVHGAEPPQELAALATRGWREVTVVELLPELGGNFGRTTRWGMLQDLKRYGVGIRPATRVRAIVPAGLELEGEGGVVTLEADSVVLATGTRPDTALAQVLEARGIPYRLCGDAARPGQVIDAVHQGFAAGRELP